MEVVMAMAASVPIGIDLLGLRRASDLLLPAIIPVTEGKKRARK